MAEKQERTLALNVEGNDNVQVHTFDQENKRAETPHTVLWIHGIGDSSATAMEAFEDLRNVAQRIVAVDLPGFGKSNKNKIDFTSYENQLDFYVKVIEEIIQELKLSKIALIAHSAGAAIATLLCEKTSEIDLLVNVEGSIIYSPDSLSSQCVSETDGGNFSQWFVVLKDNIRSMGKTNESYRRYSEALDEALPEVFQAVSRGLVDLSKEMAERYAALKIPKCFIHGDMATPIFEPIIKKYKLDSKVIPNTGHWIMLDQRAKFYGIISDILRGN